MLDFATISITAASVGAVSAAIPRIIIVIYVFKGVPPELRPPLIRALTPLLAPRSVNQPRNHSKARRAPGRTK